MASGAQCAAGTYRLLTNAVLLECNGGRESQKRPASCGQIRSPRMPSGHKARCQYARAVDKCGVGSNAIEGASRRKDLQVVDSPSMGEWRQARNVPRVRAGCGQVRCRLECNRRRESQKRPASCGQIRSPRVPSGHKARCQCARAVDKRRRVQRASGRTAAMACGA